MALTGHGHLIPGSVLGSEEPKSIKRCGGPTICPRCKDDVSAFHETWRVYVQPIEYGRSTVPANVPDDFQARAKQILINYIDSNYSQSFEKPVFEVYIVWFVKVLQHWKALVCTDRPDGKYYELTYNGDKRETYVDEYTKVKNTVVPD